MNFSEMLEKARAGEKLRRRVWPDSLCYVFMKDNRIKAGNTFDNCTTTVDFTYDDYLANDWELHQYFENKKMVEYGMEIINELVSRQDFPLAAKVRELVDYIKEKK